MQSRGSNQRLAAMGSGSRPSTLLFALFSTVAAVYVAGRLWQDAQNRIYLIKELDRITGLGKSAISVEDSLKIIGCKEQQKKLEALEMELAAARQEGFVTKPFPRNSGSGLEKRPLVVIGIHTTFGHKRNRDAIRKAWMSTGVGLKKMEDEKGIVIRFIIGRSANRGDSLDRAIINENKQTNDFIILDHVEAPEELPKKTKLFFAHAADNWDAEFYAKVNDDVYVNIDALATTLEAHLQEPRTYIGCMKSGEVFSDVGHKWYEPDWWKFGDGKTYFRYASGEMYVISRGLAKFISINRSIIRTYAHDDVSAGSWFIGLNAKHVHEPKLCCSSWSSAPGFLDFRFDEENNHVPAPSLDIIRGFLPSRYIADTGQCKPNNSLPQQAVPIQS